MAGKLTEEQRQEIVRRYEAGESCYLLAARYGVGDECIRQTLKKAGIDRRPKQEANPRLLTEEQIGVVVEEYRAGMTTPELARKYGIGKETVTRYLREKNVIRGRGERTTKIFNLPINQVSAEQWARLYLARSGPMPMPSIALLARHFDCHESAIKRRLLAAGIRLRSFGEQQREEFRYNRRAKPPGRVENLWRFQEQRTEAFTRRISEQHRQNLLKAARDPKRLRRHTQPCYWCGNLVQRHESKAVRHPLAFCKPTGGRGDMSLCQRKGTNWSVWRSECPRPLILERLRELVREHPYKALPFTVETVEKAGATIGAQEAEIFEVWHEMSAEQGALARVINAPPMVAGPAKKPSRPKPAISPESLGAVGEAMIRAERKERG